MDIFETHDNVQRRWRYPNRANAEQVVRAFDANAYAASASIPGPYLCIKVGIKPSNTGRLGELRDWLKARGLQVEERAARGHWPAHLLIIDTVTFKAAA